jgi:ubiquinone/menaquinone biosynthesis C-methylase UbiE
MSDSGYTDETGSAESNIPGADGGKDGADGEEGEGKKPGEEEEEHKEPEPEPEPEPDPLEGLTYDDDPDAPLPPYGDREYWEKRYTDDPEVFEWYQEPEPILGAIKPYFEGEGVRALVVGTGNSDLAPQLAQQGLESVVAIDFVKPCIVKSRRRNREIENISWKIMDVRKLTFPESNFQLVVDKGLLDCLFFISDSDVNTALAEISRVLRRGGTYICVSYAPPDARQSFLDRPSDLQLKLERVVELAKPLPTEDKHYLYIIKKVGKVIKPT